MGEGERRKGLGLAPRILKPGEQIQVDLKNATPQQCECSCKFFVAVIEVFVISALLSPTGQEMMVQKPVLVCQDCKKVLNLKPAENSN